MIGRSVMGLLLALMSAGALLGDDPKVPDTKFHDKLIVDTLRDVHNTGAELYNNSRDFAGTYRMYQGALLTARPFLAHHPAAQKLIDDGLANAENEPLVSLKAFKLHETIEGVRSMLKAGLEPKPKADEIKKPMETKKPAEPAEIKKSPEKPSYELAPTPREKKGG